MFWRCMLLRLRYFIILEGSKTQKTVTRSVLPSLHKCTHARCYTLLYRIIYTLQHYNYLKTSTQKQITGRSFIRVCLLWWQGTMSAHDYHFQTAKGTNLHCTTEPKWAKVCRLPRWILHTAVWSILHDLLASMKTERLIRTDTMFQSGDE